MTAAWIGARLCSGTIHPVDALASVAIAALPVGVEEGLDHLKIPLTRWQTRGGAFALAFLMLFMAVRLHSRRPSLPAVSTTKDMEVVARPPSTENPAVDERVRGYLPAEEEALLRYTDMMIPPPPIEKVAVGSSRWTQVAEVRLRVDGDWSPLMRQATQWHAARVIKEILIRRPAVSEVDVWAGISSWTPAGKEVVRTLLSVQARRYKADRLLAARRRDLGRNIYALLSSVGTVYCVTEESRKPRVGPGPEAGKEAG